MADIAAKQFRAEELRQKLAVLRVQHTADVQEADVASLDAKLDEEIALLEKQVAIEEKRKETGGSVTEAMDIMAEAARLEEENAASLEAASGSAVVLVPVSGGEDTTDDKPADTGTEEVPDAEAVKPAEEAPATPTMVTPVAGMGLTAPAATTGGSQ